MVWEEGAGKAVIRLKIKSKVKQRRMEHGSDRQAKLARLGGIATGVRRPRGRRAARWGAPELHRGLRGSDRIPPWPVHSASAAAGVRLTRPE